MSIVVRRMTMDDLDGVMLVEVDSFLTPWSRSAFEEELSQNRLARYLVAVDNGAVIGYAGTWLVINEAHVTNVAVSGQRRREGIGRLLMEKLMDLSRDSGMDSMTLEVRVSNEAARHLYQQLGFVEAGLRKNYYSETKEDALILWREQL
ncbi:MAG TPA: ribosomal protein S18-alanine N-acetyltransferase [Negativicutes bacterium]|nr:ribosomal protein S18-alanine N-acetyltransferase [Negativicutes bacterium]